MTKHSDFLIYLNKNKLFAGLLVFIFFALGTFVTLTRDFQYSSKVNLLVIHKINGNLDAYTAARAAEKLSHNLSEIIYSTSFLDIVLLNNAELQNELPQEPNKIRKAWQKKVDTEVKSNSSVLEITAYDSQPNRAEQLVFDIAHVLVDRGAEYHGGGDNIVIKIIDEPLTSIYPVKPNLPLNLTIVFILSLLVSYFVMLRNFYSHKKKFHLLG